MLTPAPVQPTYTRYQPIAQNGMRASETPYAVDTRIVETAAGIGFGLAVSQGALSDRGCIIGGAAFVGVTVADQTLPRADVTPAMPVDVYSQYDNAGIATMGDWFVNCYASVTPATAVVFEVATGKLGIAGTSITHARWMTSAAGTAGTPQLAVLRLGDMSSK